ncbi:hypothetical protein GIB67_024346 [Kingdonia uniflora]|uniref:Retrotransposon gag domain-containing protein n=1 Tax=Kingdonia uniflora TaxID=39325 RepID=A0A7J7LFC1_9MAGN|nr:hypothetical protein GIB67_024346 [Kingdonia uniflora]
MLAFQTALKVLQSSQQPPALREREIVPKILRVSVYEMLGAHEVHSADISRIHCEDPPTPIVSIHLGQEVQTNISRDRRPSKQPEEALRPPYQSPLPERVSEGTATPVVPAAPAVPVAPTGPIPQHYISQELMDQRIREIIEATALNAKDDSYKLQGFHTPKIIKYKGINPGQHVQQFRDSLEGSIHTFEQLQKIFIKVYAYNKDKEENLYSLISLKQTHGEKLEEFSKKFLKLARKVDNQDQKIAVSAFINALQFNCNAKEYLFLKKPKTLEDMIEKVNNYIDLERMMPESNKPVKAVHNTKAPYTDFNNNCSSNEPGDPK